MANTLRSAFLGIILGSLVLGLGGCAQKEKEPTGVLEAQKEEIKSDLSEKYNDYLLLMDDDQRARFFQLETDLQRDRFLQAEGVKYKKFLYDNLQEGMEITKVRKLLGHRPANTETNLQLGRKEVRLIYEQFNGYNNMKYALLFEDDRLVSWNLWLY